MGKRPAFVYSGVSSFRRCAFIVVELRAPMDAGGEVASLLDAEELLGGIFSTFCIGN